MSEGASLEGVVECMEPRLENRRLRPKPETLLEVVIEYLFLEGSTEWFLLAEREEMISSAERLHAVWH